MATLLPRLLVGLRPRDEVGLQVAERLPRIPWTYARGDLSLPWTDVEAILVGSVERDLPGFDATTTPKLIFVQGIYTGLDGFPFELFPARVRIAGNVGAFGPFVAEHAVTLALAAARQIVPAQAKVRAGELRPAPDQHVLRGRTAVILGYGEIGKAIARRLEGFEMRVVGVNRTGRMAPDCDAVYPAERLKDAVADATLVFDVRPLTRATRGTIGRGELEAMPPDAVYVNVGRAGTVDEEALYRHLKEQPSFRAALDVWWEEDYRTGKFRTRFPFTDLPNFLGTPHSAGVGPSVEPYVLARALDNLARFFSGETPLYVVDREEYAPEASSSTP